MSDGMNNFGGPDLGRQQTAHCAKHGGFNPQGVGWYPTGS